MSGQQNQDAKGMTPLNRIRRGTAGYPRQFWPLFWGLLVNATGTSIVGGFLNDKLAPVSIWYGGLVMGLGAALGFVLLARALRAQTRSQKEGA